MNDLAAANPDGSGTPMDPTIKPEDELIFVSIAAYRDPQLVPTVNDCIAKARHPERLRFGICWQHGSDEPPLPFAADDRIRILDVDWRKSKGACWARAEVMKLWQGENWFLQLDSHCRFVKNWDERTIDAIRLAPSAKPILSTYGTSFTPRERERLQGEPLLIAIQGFNADGIPQLKPLVIPDWAKRSEPVPARFLGAGFLFTSGNFVEEVGYDPELYFYGEEPAMTVRAFTHGYDLYHPCHTLVFHDYVRSDGTRHWDNHKKADCAEEDRAASNAVSDWSELDARSRDKVKRLLTGEPVESYGLGTVRSLQDFEEYAGLSFSLRKVQDYTLRGQQPPNPPAPADWADRIYAWIVRILMDRTALPDGSLDDPSFWCVGIYDEEQREIYRRDCPPGDLEIFTGNEPKIAVVCELQSGTIPASWAVWPVSRSRGWLEKLDGVFADGDYAILREDEPGVDAAADLEP